ncbi:MAG: phosphopantetheine-binding protein, partial [Pseudonocardiaceae bacterium]
VRGALVLDRVLDGNPLDFFALCSSLGPILYKLKFGEVGYVAGNEFCNAFAAYRAWRGHAGTVAIAWTDWLEAGMWARARERLGEYELAGLDASLADDLLRGITEAEGVEVFRRILGLDHAPPNVVVSTQDLDALLAHHDAFSTAAHRELVDRLRLTPGSRGTSRREPAGERPLPATPAEAMIAQMWQALLGVDAVGLDDNFFELGGDSLLALRFLSQLRDGFGVEHPIARMFDAPTVRAVAAEVELAGGDRAAAGEEEVLL